MCTMCAEAASCDVGRQRICQGYHHTRGRPPPGSVFFTLQRPDLGQGRAGAAALRNTQVGAAEGSGRGGEASHSQHPCCHHIIRCYSQCAGRTASNPCKLPCKECLAAVNSCGKQVNGSTLLRESIMTRMKILDWSGMLHQCKMLVAHATTIENAIKHVRSLNIGFFSDPLIVRWYVYDACHYCQSMCLHST